MSRLYIKDYLMSGVLAWIAAMNSAKEIDLNEDFLPAFDRYLNVLEPATI